MLDYSLSKKDVSVTQKVAFVSDSTDRIVLQFYSEVCNHFNFFEFIYILGNDVVKFLQNFFN